MARQEGEYEGAFGSVPLCYFRTLSKHGFHIFEDRWLSKDFTVAFVLWIGRYTKSGYNAERFQSTWYRTFDFITTKIIVS